VKATFDHLSEAKKRRVIESCIEEFGEKGYENGSTDGIVKRSGISKGGLYEYISSKEELFLYVVDYSYGHLYGFIRDRIRKSGKSLPGDILERFRLVSGFAIDFYMEHPKVIQVIVKAGKLEDPDLAERVQKIFQGHFSGIFGDIDASGLRFGKKGLLDLFQWMLVKTRNDFLAKSARTKKGDLNEVRKAYLDEWDFILDIFRAGIYTGN
jgi:TetR/AcrR family transcriptional regulator